MPQRIRMSLRLKPEVRNFTLPLVPATEEVLLPMAEALLDAYAGTVDDEHETLEEALEELRRVFRGFYGTFLPQASHLILEDNRVLSGVLTCLYRGEPTITNTFTRKSAQRLGYATHLVMKAADVLAQEGFHSLYLFVSVENRQAIALYESLGFEKVPLTTVTEIHVD